MSYPKQYLLSALPFEAFADWKQVCFFGWYLTLAPDVPVIRVRNTLGDDIGLLFGWIIFRGRLLGDGEIITSQFQCDGIAVEFVDFCGRFNYLYWYQCAVYCMSDAGGLLSPVYNVKQRVLASTPTLLKQIFPQYPAQKTLTALAAGKQKAWYAFGATPYNDVRRLLPNHRLSLSDWNQTRIFPALSGIQCGQEAIPEMVSRLAIGVKANMAALLDGGYTSINLTGARDTRKLLASCREQLQQCRFQTVAGDNATDRLHCHLARELSRRFGLHHSELPAPKPVTPKIESWREQTSAITDGTSAGLLGADANYREISHEYAVVGTGAQVAQAYFWHPGDEQRSSLSARELLMRMNIVPNGIAIGLAEKWLHGLKGCSVGAILDLAYIEMWLGCRAGADIYGSPGNLPPLSPFNSRAFYSGILALPAEYRAARRFATDYLTLLWPELLAIPFDRARGFSKLKFLHAEIGPLIPNPLRAVLKRLRWHLCAGNERFKHHQTFTIPPSDA